MNRTVQATIIFALALVTLGISIWGRVLGERAEQTIRERQAFELHIDRFQSLQTQRLALTHRLKRLYGRQAQLQAVQAPAAEIASVTADITSGEERLKALNKELAEAEARIKPRASPPEP